jgi:hypothetical protein
MVSVIYFDSKPPNNILAVLPLCHPFSVGARRESQAVQGGDKIELAPAAGESRDKSLSNFLTVGRPTLPICRPTGEAKAMLRGRPNLQPWALPRCEAHPCSLSVLIGDVRPSKYRGLH